ncbi:MAG: SDR family oxidoreductase [Bacteroidetes bacterium]|nr:SDR family oxidoreductase [Bacteroidota bacterium]
MILENKTIIITGAANGIGKNVAELLYAKGCNIIVCDILQEQLQHVYASFSDKKILIYAFDIRKPDLWEKMMNHAMAKFSRIDALLNIAGVIEPGYIYQTPIEHVDRQIDINLKGSIYGCQYVSKIMVKQQSGHIINISSMAGLAPIPGLDIYSATKFGIRGFTLAIAQELDAFGIKVSLVCPDAVKTQMLDYQKDKKEAAMTFSAGRFLSAEEVSIAIVSLLEKPKAEVWLPHSRGILASLSGLFPGITSFLKKKLIAKGLAQQKNYAQ